MTMTMSFLSVSPVSFGRSPSVQSMDVNLHRALSAHLNTVEGLVGHSTEGALRTLLQPEVRRAFEAVGREFEEGVLENDKLLEAIVERALILRVAVAKRWYVAGASPLERRLAAEVDRVLNNRSAVLMVDGTEDWLADIDHQMEIDPKSWWGFQASPRWVALGETLTRETIVAAWGHAPRHLPWPSVEEACGDAEYGGYDGWEDFVRWHEAAEDALVEWVIAAKGQCHYYNSGARRSRGSIVEQRIGPEYG